MILKGLIDSDFVNYKKPCMTLMFPTCNFKCDQECGEPVCQNSTLAQEPNIEVDIRSLVDRYINNPITKAVCMQGLEPFDSWDDLYAFIHLFSRRCDDDIVIYTGYNEDEIKCNIELLRMDIGQKVINIDKGEKANNVIIKFGRFIPGQKLHFDDVLGVNLASDNQYAKRIF